MKSYAISLILFFTTCFVYAFDEEVYMFLPFLKNYSPPPPCPTNELYKTCTGNCSDCTQRGLCTIKTCIQGCDCAPHFFRVTPDGPCEPVANCPKPVCGENEEFRECGPVCERCSTLKCRIISCEHTCYCKEGYLRNREDVCIPADECPPKLHCTLNEEWGVSGPVDEFCMHENANFTEEIRNVSQCYCKEGYKRNALGHCMTERFCPILQCLGGEMYYDCTPKCNTTCRNLGDPECIEDGNCFPGCFCQPGQVMNDFRICIPIDNCTLEIPQVKVIHTYKTEDEEYSDDSGNTTDSDPDLITYANTEHPDTEGVPDESDSVSVNVSNEPETSLEERDAGTTVSSISSTPVISVSSTPVIVTSPKKKDHGKLKAANVSSQKYSYAISSSKASSKQESSNTEENFDNE